MNTNIKHLIAALAAIFLLVSSANAAALYTPTYLTHGSDVDMEQTFETVLSHAENGDAKAQFDLGLHYILGDGVELNEKRAFPWIEKAAKQNLAVAKLVLAIFYIDGNEVPKDVAFGESLLLQAAEQGVIDACLILGRIYTRDQEKKDFTAASFWLKKAADQGSIKAMEMMTLLYLDGRVVDPDERKAAYWMQRGSDAGDIRATYNLAYYYLEGTGVDKNIAKGTGLLKQAAMKGDGFSIDYFVRQAAIKNNSEAQRFLEQLYAEKGHDTEAFKKYRQDTD
jgi:uncharacterized protein